MEVPKVTRLNMLRWHTGCAKHTVTLTGPLHANNMQEMKNTRQPLRLMIPRIDKGTHTVRIEKEQQKLSDSNYKKHK